MGLRAQAPALVCGVLAILVLATIAFYRLPDMPIEQFDEARVANNALEMSLSGPSLVTTYGGQPDHYNTKPPLLVWLIAGSISLLGLDRAWLLQIAVGNFGDSHRPHGLCRLARYGCGDPWPA